MKRNILPFIMFDSRIILQVHDELVIETKAEELETELPEILFSKGAAVIDVYVPQDENVLPMVPVGKRIDQMVLE